MNVDPYHTINHNEYILVMRKIRETRSNGKYNSDRRNASCDLCPIQWWREWSIKLCLSSGAENEVKWYNKGRVVHVHINDVHIVVFIYVHFLLFFLVLLCSTSIWEIKREKAGVFHYIVSVRLREKNSSKIVMCVFGCEYEFSYCFFSFIIIFFFFFLGGIFFFFVFVDFYSFCIFLSVSFYDFMRIIVRKL